MSTAALQRVTAVLDRYEATGEPTVLLDADLSAEEQHLATKAGDGSRRRGRDAATTLARLHWYRYLLLPGLDGLRKRRAAVRLYRGLLRRHREAVPEPLRDECREDPAPRADDLSTVLLSPQQAQRIAGLWQRHHAGDGRALPMLVTLYREWSESMERQRSMPGLLLPAALRTDLTDALFTLAEQVGGRYSHTDALAAAADAVATTTARDPHRASRLTVHGRLFELYFDRGAGRRALELAVDTYRKAAQLGWQQQQPTDLNRVARLASALCRLYEIAAVSPVELVLEATAAWRDAVARTAPDDPELEVRLRRLNETANLLVDAVGVGPVQTILSAAPEPGTLGQLFHQVEALDDRVRVDASPQSLAERRDAALMLFASVPAFHQERPRALLALADAESDRWQHGGELDGAVRAATWADVALIAAGQGHPLRRRILSLLAYTASMAGLHGRSEAKVDTAVEAARAALDLTDESSEHHAGQLATLADVLAHAGHLRKDPVVLDEALRYERAALEHTSTDDDNYPLRLMNLGAILTQADLLAPDDALLAEAVRANRRALDVLPHDDSRRVGFTYNLASSLTRYAIRRRDTDGLLAADRIYQDALALLPTGHPDHPRINSSIAEARHERYRVSGDLAVLRSAVELAGEALHQTPADNHWWPIRAQIRARAATDLARLGGPDAERARADASDTYAALATSPVTAPQARIDAERQRAELAQEAADPAARLAALERAVRRMPEIATRSTAGRRRLTALGSVGGLAAEAAAAAVAAQEPDTAVELLERGRGLLFHEALGIRTARTRLRAVDPGVAAELKRVDRELSTADSYTSIAAFTIEVERRSASGELLDKSSTEWDPRPIWVPLTRKLAAERDRLVDRIRALPGFDDLLRPPSLPVLRERLRGLPVVMVTTHGDRGDALLVPAEPDRPVQPIRLPELHETVVRERVVQLHRAVADATNVDMPFDRRLRAQQDLLGVLAWLWDAVTGPILDLIAPVGGQPPRVWWCPVGNLARLPLHAAGHHREQGRTRTVLDRVVSSYTPTLTALADTVAERPPRLSTPTATIVGVPGAEGAAALPEVRAEADEVARLIPGSAVLTGAEVATRDVEDMLRIHPIAHFACHGRADTTADAMLLGGLRLGSETLSPHMVQSYQLDHSELAFLSACSTAEIHPTFTDEPLHLASAFQLAGFRGVVGTMWRTTDTARIAKAFYRALTRDGTRPPDTAAAAQALNDTIRAARDEFTSTPTRWAGYIHVGHNQPLPTSPDVALRS